MAGFTVTSVTEDQIPDASDNLVDVYNVTFTIADKPGSFNVQVLKDQDPVTTASQEIDAAVAEVLAIYAL